MTVCIIQITQGGVPDTPEVYAGEVRALARWRALYKEGFRYAGGMRVNASEVDEHDLLEDEYGDNEARYYLNCDVLKEPT